jgi:hypothetical protein
MATQLPFGDAGLVRRVPGHYTPGLITAIVALITTGSRAEPVACHPVLKAAGLKPFEGSVIYGILPIAYFSTHSIYSRNEGITMDPDRKKALAAALTQIERQFGKG